MITYIKVDEEWVEGVPVDGDVVKYLYPDGHSLEVTYKDPVPEVIPPIRNISVRAFFERIPKASRKLLKKSNDEGVQDISAGIQLTAYVNLDSPITARDLATLVTSAIITQVESDAMLVDGNEFEEYRGVL